MKKLLLVIVSGVLIFTSCEKCDKKNPCPVVPTATVPLPVKDAQASRYANVTVDSWYNTDNNGYCAKFNNNGKSSLAFYGNDGSFIKDNEQGNHDGEHENDDHGCDCGGDNEQDGEH